MSKRALLRRRRGWENNIKMDLKEVERSAWSGLMWLSGKNKWWAVAKNVINFGSQNCEKFFDYPWRDDFLAEPAAWS